ncbi:hypothetical protein ILUMI_20992 [Ignelater luminosus]|uniref:Uncharacterized protein n=1 Tax=Ignelater luminosus TaxID=2038154 RepID=A0A8K0FYE3_IGNLU|nr:hypothetical protein ILUMI_20992 [Ignelater luminosus]
MMADVNQLSALLASFVNQQSELLASFRSQASSAPSPQPSQTSNFEQFVESKEDFKVYSHRLENYFNLKNVIDGSPGVDKLKAQILINCIGSKYYQWLLCLTSPETPRDKTYSELVTLIENHLCPQPNESQYTVALRKLSSTCNFACPEPTCKKSIAQVFLQAQFIRGLSDPTIREKLLQEKDLTFGNATKIALALEASKLGNRVLSSSTEGEVNSKIPNYTCSLKLKNDNIKPIFIKHRQVPYALQEKVDTELDQLVANGVIERVDYSQKFTLVTDNKPLCHIFSPKKKLPEITASRLLRYALFLSGFDYEIKYRSQEHGNADYLSRAPLPVISNTIDIEYEICKLTINQISTDVVTHKSLSKETECDPELFSLKQDLLNATPLFSGGKSPAENFLGRNLRTRLDLLHFRPPRCQNLNLQPAVPPSRILCLGDRVHSRNYGSSMHWKCGTVVDVLGRLHYLIELDDGYIIKRHIDQLRRTEVSPETITNRKILPNVTSLPDQTSATQNMLGRHHSQAEVVCKQPPALSTDCSGEAAPQLTSAIPSQTSAEEPPANATPVVSTPSSQPRKSTRVRKPVVKLNL